MNAVSSINSISPAIISSHWNSTTGEGWVKASTETAELNKSLRSAGFRVSRWRIEDDGTESACLTLLIESDCNTED